MDLRSEPARAGGGGPSEGGGRAGSSGDQRSGAGFSRISEQSDRGASNRRRPARGPSARPTAPAASTSQSYQSCQRTSAELLAMMMVICQRRRRRSTSGGGGAGNYVKSSRSVRRINPILSLKVALGLLCASLLLNYLKPAAESGGSLAVEARQQQQRAASGAGDQSLADSSADPSLAELALASLGRDQRQANSNNQPLKPMTAASSSADLFGSRLATAESAPTATASDNQMSSFANRQGQLLPPASGADLRRQQQLRNQQQQQLLQLQLQQQQQAGNNRQLLAGRQQAQAGSAPEMQPRFQRLRAPSGGGGEQLLGSNQQLAPAQAGPPSTSGQQLPALTQFAPHQANNNNRGQQQQAPPSGAGSLVPTLSAFDLSSLANLANQAQLQQQQPTFRRLPQAPQQQGQRANNVFEAAAGASNNQRANPALLLSANNIQPPTAGNNGFGAQPAATSFASSQSNAGGPQTELPFVRQVFKQPPVSEQPAPSLASGADQLPAEASVGGGRPTPPPLFVPGGRPNRRLVPETGGFSPMLPQAGGAAQSAAGVFFEPLASRAQSQPAGGSGQQQQQPPQRARSPQAQPPRLQQQEPQPQQAQQPQQPQQRPTGAPQSAGQPIGETQQQAPAERRRPPARRPSQRPQLPRVAGADGPSGGQQQAARTAPPPTATDVIRLASSAIQTANAGLSIIAPPAQPESNSFFGLPNFGGGAPDDGPERLPASTTSSTTAATPTTTQPDLLGGEQPAGGSGAGGLARRLNGPLRTSANFFTSLTSAATSSPQQQSPFSPALPINAAVAASGQRRRIPVRNPQQSGQQQQQQLARTTTALSVGAQQQPTTTTTAASTLLDRVTLPPASTTTAAAAAAATTTATLLRLPSQSSGQSVRRPEIEEFYETIGSGFSSSTLNAATTIDGFGAPSRQQQAAATPTTSQPDSDRNQQPTTPAADLYGSRLSPGPPNESQASAAPESPQQQAAAAAAADQASNSRAQQASSAPSGEPSAAASPASGAGGQAPVMVPVTYMTTLTYLTTVLHGTHTLETWHESVVKSTEMATLNAQLMDQIEHRRPLIEPTATLAVSSKTKGKGTTIVNLKSAVSAYNQELVEALGGQQQQSGQSSQASSSVLATAAPAPAQQEPSSRQFQTLQPARSRALARASRTVALDELQEARRSLLTEYVYLYTLKPVEPASGEPVTSVRSELVGASVDGADQQLRSLLGSAASAQLIDSNGMLRVNQETRALNLGSTLGPDGATLTEVNMNVATYIKFDDITNAFVDVKPTRLAQPTEQQPAPASQAPPRQQLETSFNVHLTLGSALDKLLQPAAAQPGATHQQTPALDSSLSPALAQAAATAKLDHDLLRSTSASARSQLRSRVASSRFRQAPLQSSLLARQQAQLDQQQQQQSLLSTAGQQVPASTAPPGGRQQRPVKSRIARPSLLKQSPDASSAPGADSLLGASSLAPTAAAAAGSTQAASASGRSSSKPRFVVVTRTGQFGIRASAMSSMAAAAAAASASGSASGAEPALATNQVRSRFSKPSRFRGSSSAIQPARSAPAAAEQTASPTVPTTSAQGEQEQSGSGPSTTTTAAPATSAAGDSDGQRGPTDTAASSEAATTTTAAGGATSSSSSSSNPQQGGTENKSSDDDSAAPVVVTYFTTTTHTIPFTINSETIFTTIEETNSRIATEYMRDLGSHFIEPTPMVSPGQPSSASSQQLGESSAPAGATTTTTTAGPTTQQTPTTGGEAGQQAASATSSQPAGASGQEAATTAPSPAPTTTGAAAADDQAAGANNRQQLSLEPSFVVALNTRTYFTTFTYFTTLSMGNASPTVRSSESTTSNIVTETLTSLLEPTRSQAGGEQTAAPTLAPTTTTESNNRDRDQEQQQQALAPPSAAPTEGLPTTRTLLSTMTYYGTLYNGTQTSLTPIVDISTQVLTLGANQQSPELMMLYTSQQPIAPSQTEQARQLQTAAAADSVSVSAPPPAGASAPDKITRTRSLYTTLTHFITFYSGTKTQLSTIQEISPTVVTEYIDRTLFEQQQAAGSAGDISRAISVLDSVLVVPSASQAGVAQLSLQQQPTLLLTASPVLPPMLTTPTVADGGPEQSQATTYTDGSPTTDQQQAPGAFTSTPSGQPAEQSPPDKSDEAEPGAKDSGTAQGALEGKQAPPSIIELSDLIASNSSQGGRVALAGNLGAAIKDIVQLLAGNKTAATGAGPQAPATQQAPTTGGDQQAATTTTSGAEPASGGPITTQQPASTVYTAANKHRPPTRLYGAKAKEQQQQMLLNLQGSITSPSSAGAAGDQATQQAGAGSSARVTPELSAAASSVLQQQQQQAAATIFFGDDGGDERKKHIKTVWPAASQSTVYITSIEPSTRSLTMTTTKVYYTRDAPITVTSSFTSAIAPRTFVSTIMGTRTLVNQLGAPTASVAQAPTVAAVLEASSGSSKQQSPPGPSRQDGQAANHRLSVQQKQQKQEQHEKKKQQLQQQQAAGSKQKPSVARTADLAQQAANINQCQPACKQSNNEICKFTPTSETVGAQGTFACACRPGYHMQTIVQAAAGDKPASTQRQCQEVQSYVVLLRLLQLGDQQVVFKRELQDRTSVEFKQFSRVIRDHVKRAYMTSELTRDRFVGADVTNYARNANHQPPPRRQLGAGQSATAAANISAPGASSGFDSSQTGSNGIIVNITVQLQPPAPNANEILDENTLKEELTKKLNLRQAAALAAAAAAAAGSPASPASSSSPAGPPTSTSAADGSSASDASSASAATATANETSAGSSSEPLPNPNALFLADVEQVLDLDECASPVLNDCHEGAVCVNEPGSYKCDCRDYPDLNPLNPGRQCASVIKSCDYCHNRGDCFRQPSLVPSLAFNSSNPPMGNGQGLAYTTACECQRIYLGRRCEFNGLLLATLLPIAACLLVVSVFLTIYCCRRYKRRSAISKGFRNIGTFGPNLIGGTLDRKAMLESSSESSDTHQRSHHLRNAANGIYDTHGGLPSDPSSSSNESSPRQMVRNQMVDGGMLQAANSGAAGYHLSASGATVEGARQQLGPFCSSIPPQIVIPRARHNQVNYAVHRGQVYMW